MAATFLWIHALLSLNNNDYRRNKMMEFQKSLNFALKPVFDQTFRNFDFCLKLLSTWLQMQK